MKLSHLIKEIQSYVVALYHECPEQKVSFLATLKNLREEALLMIKKPQFLRDFLHLESEKPSNLTLVIAKSIADKNAEEVTQVAQNYPVVVVENISQVTVLLSKIFYHQWMENLPHTSEIDPLAQVSPQAIVAPGVRIAEKAIIHPGAILQRGVEVGAESEIFPGVVLYPGVKVGDRVRLHAQVTLGSDGFGYEFLEGAHQKIWHQGGVIVGDDVEIGAQSTVDGGTFSPTVIGEGTRIDNQVQIAHNVIIGNHVILCSQVGIAGSVEIADYCVLGGKVGISHGAQLGAGCQVAGGSLVHGTWKPGSRLAGYPATSFSEWKRGIMASRRLARGKKHE